MSACVPRLRMLAGPNGSGKSTIKAELGSKLLGTFVNPDEIEREIHEQTFLDLTAYEIEGASQELSKFFASSSLLKEADLLGQAQHIRLSDNKIILNDVKMNSYFASVIADFVRRKLFESGKSFTIETVMSFPDKIELLQEAQAKGYRTYLYYIATESPIINISRVLYRVKMGGHPVPEDKIVSRYERSLELLMEAVRHTHRAYIFDNSGSEFIWLAEITDGRSLEMKTPQMPAWFKKALWDKFSAAATKSM